MTDGPDSEWMLWAKRFKDIQAGLKKRIEVLEHECKDSRQEKEGAQRSVESIVISSVGQESFF